MNNDESNRESGPDPGRRAFLTRTGRTAGKPLGWARVGRRAARHLGRMLMRGRLSRFLR